MRTASSTARRRDTGRTSTCADSSYDCKNAPFESVDELLLVYGAEWAVLYGEDTNRNGLLDANEDDGSATAPDDNADGTLDTGIVPLLTVHTREPNLARDGSARVNVNQGADQLPDVLEEILGDERAGEIVQQLAGARRTYSSLADFFIASGMTVEEFDRVADGLSASSDEILEGRVNVNTAGAAVLACLPGIDEEKAAAWVAQRSAPAAGIAGIVEFLGEEAALQAGPYLTARSYQATADVVAVGRHGRGYRRAVFVIDTSGEEPRIRYRRDLHALGWALGRDTRERLTEEGENSG